MCRYRYDNAVASLDDEIRAERARNDAQDTAAKRRAEKKQRERDEVREIALQTVSHLADFGSQTFVLVRSMRWSLFNPIYLGADGTRYRLVSRQRCWQLADIFSRRSPDSPMLAAPVLLTEDGTIGQLQPIDLAKCPRGEYVSDTALASIQDSLPSMFGGGGDYVTAVKRRAPACSGIVRF